MKVKDLIKQLLDCRMDAEVVVSKELDYNIWISGAPVIKIDGDIVILTFDFKSSNFEIKRKE